MKKKPEKSKREAKPKGGRRIAGRELLGPVLAAIAIAVAFAFLHKGGIAEGLSGRDVSFLLFPTLVGLAMVLVAQVVGALFAGTLVPTIRGVIYCLAIRLFFSLLLNDPPTPWQYRPAALPVFILAVIAAAYLLARALTKQLPLLRIVAKSVTIFMAGLVVWFLFGSVLPSLSGLPLPLTSIPLPPVFLASFVLAAAFVAISALSLSKNSYLSVSGRWFGSAAAYAFFLGLFLALYFTSLRSSASALLGWWLPVTEWGVVCLVCGVGFWMLRSGVKLASKPVSYGAWAKHLQIVEMKGREEVADVAALVREFVENGSNGGLLVHLISEAGAAGVSRERILGAVEEMVDYRDAPLPRVAFRWEVERVRRANREARKAVLEKTIREVGRL